MRSIIFTNLFYIFYVINSVENCQWTFILALNNPRKTNAILYLSCDKGACKSYWTGAVQFVKSSFPGLWNGA